MSVSLRGGSSRLRSGGSLAIESRSAVDGGVGAQLGVGDERDPFAVGRHDGVAMRVVRVRELPSRGRPGRSI